MSARFSKLWVLGALCLAAGCEYTAHAGAASAPGSGDDFTVILLPDTQYYYGDQHHHLEKQVEWIVEQHRSERIAYVVHLGDITDDNSAGEWKAADRTLRLLDDAGVPWSPMPGNHDGYTGRRKGTDQYNRYFGVERFANRPWYGGNYGEGNESHYARIEIGELNLLILSLAYGAPADHLRWAGQVVAEHSDHQVMVATHAYLDRAGTYLERGERWAVRRRGWSDGRQIWERLVKRHPNIFMVVCGHIFGAARRVVTGDHGNSIHEVLSNYQWLDEGGSGYLRILRFSPGRGRIAVRTYSPSLDSHLTGPEHEFELRYSTSNR